MQTTQLQQILNTTLLDGKAHDLQSLDVRPLTSITDFLLICSGTSSRHVTSLADKVVRAAKEAGTAVLGIEGKQQGDWALINLGDIIVHIMRPEIREFYALEQLWCIKPPVNSNELSTTR